MKSVQTVLLSALAASPLAYAATEATSACASLFKEHPLKTFFPGESRYLTDNTNYWTAAEWLGPACIFAPSSAQEMAHAVKTLKSKKAPFALRGGGHMPIPEHGNINHRGVLLSASNMKQLKLSKDKNVISVGPGNRWEDVYKYLQSHELNVVGGRLGPIGVPGLLLGGGMSFLSNQHGWASDNVKKYECVLASGEVVEATATGKHSDLYWALRGGGNSFCIVTSFDLKTFESPVITAGNVVYGVGMRDEFLEAVHKFAMVGSKDAKAAVIPTASWGSQTLYLKAYTNMLFYDGNNTSPAAFDSITAPAISCLDNAVAPRTMYNWTQVNEKELESIHGKRNKFYALVTFPTVEAMGIVHDTFFDMAALMLTHVDGFLGSVAFMPVTKRWLKAGHENGGVGNPMGLDASKAPYLFIEQSLMWEDSKDDATVEAFVLAANKEINKKLDAIGKRASFVYLNDADKTQKVFEGYPKANLARLKKIRSKYDPSRVFTDLMAGGWKVAAAS